MPSSSVHDFLWTIHWKNKKTKKHGKSRRPLTRKDAESWLIDVNAKQDPSYHYWLEVHSRIKN